MFKWPQLIVMKCSGSKGKRSQLLNHGIFNPWMAVTLVDGRVGRQKIVVALSFHIPYKNTLTSGQHHGQRMVIVGTILFFQSDCLTT